MALGCATLAIGLSLTLIGLVLMLGRIWDTISDPLIGAMSDRTQSRFGRRRPSGLIRVVPIGSTWIAHAHLISAGYLRADRSCAAADS